MIKKEYKLLRGDNIEQIEERVNSDIDCGWNCQGGIAAVVEKEWYTNQPETTITRFYQAMTKDIERTY
jgi:hypothetical protein